MSGIEIAGLVLGAIPLVISALEHYENALDSTIAFIRWNRELSTAIQKLWYYYRITEHLYTCDTDFRCLVAGSSTHRMYNQSNFFSFLLQRTKNFMI